MLKYKTIAHPYAKALFELAQTYNCLTEWLEDLTKLEKFSQHNNFINLINDPLLSKEDIVVLILKSCNLINSKLIKFINLLADNKRLFILIAVKEIYLNYYNQYNHETQVIIETAYSLNEQQIIHLVSILSIRFKTKIKTQIILNSDLIGGIKISINDVLIDYSIKTALLKMATQLSIN